jgi:ADP-ribose pyrophosphatase YjhB (NUDIX family)
MDENVNKEEQTFLESYDPSIYDRPSVTVDMLIFSVMEEELNNYRKLPKKELKILMIKREGHPYKNKWALPGGFIEPNESVDEAAYRELKEETNVDNVYLEQLYTWGNLNRDPRTRVISCSYMALIDGTKNTVKPGSDSLETRWFNLSEKTIKETKINNGDTYSYIKEVKICLSNEDIKLSGVVRITKEKTGDKLTTKREIVSQEGTAFDHLLIIYYGLMRLRAKVEFSDIVFNLMKEEFTLTELQNVYEVILDKPLLTANFRRKIEHMVIETNETTSNFGHRPAKLYKHKPDDRFDFY